MMPLFVQIDARREFREAIAYYELQESGLGKEFGIAVFAAFKEIALNPNAFPTHTPKRVRCSTLSRFPYTIFFTVLSEAVWIVAVAHHRRRPSYWKRRLRNLTNGHITDLS